MQQKLRHRILSYLKCIRSFHTQINEKELELWQMLFTLLGPNSTTHLLPRLRTLCLTGAAETTKLPFLGGLCHIFSPTLNSITVREKWGDAWNTIEYVMDSHEFPELSELVYWDNEAPIFPTGIRRFTGLRRLVVYDSRKFDGLSSLLYLSPLRQLEDLRFSFTANNSRPPALNPISTPFFLPKLQRLQLEIDLARDLNTFLQLVKCPDLVDLSLEFWSSCTRRLPLDLVVAAYPDLQELSISFMRPKPSHSYKVTVDDLAPVIGVRGIKRLELLDVPHQLGERDIVSMMESWPGLHTLSIVNPRLEVTFSATLLTTISSSFPTLRHVNLPLNFSLLIHPLSSKHIPQSCSQIVKINASRPKGIPYELADQLTVVWNLLRLFPNLNRLSGDGELTIELHEMLTAVDRFFRPRVELPGCVTRFAEIDEKPRK